MKLLIVDQTKAIGDNLSVVLKKSGYSADVVQTDEEAFSFIKLYDYDIIMYNMLPNILDCYQFIHHLRGSVITTPLVVINNQSDPSVCVEILNLGADDCVTKPINIQELIARCKAIVRRSQGHSASAIHIGRLKIDLRRNLAEVNGYILKLTNKEYSILELLAIRKGVMISKEMFLNHLYGGLDEPEIKIVDVFICRLRKKIADITGGDNFIQTVWGRGYILEDPAEKTDLKKEVMKAG
jgi:two-component system cell cycle response regulator CtrA